jgi:tetratricopeptide (TPR) repeat protein
MLESALRQAPDDVMAWQAKGWAFQLARRHAEALAAFQSALDRAPRLESALVGAGTSAYALGQVEPALGYWRRAVEINPYAAQYRQYLALLLREKGEWEAVRPHCEAWLRLDPASAEARALWVDCLLHAGQVPEAREEFRKLEALAPPNLAELRARFADRLR